MLDKASVEEIFNNIISQRMHLSPEGWEITPLRGDASNRRYYRLHITSQVQSRSFVVMELSEPEGFKKSEEKVSSSRIPIIELPYINILRHLAACEVAVPELYYYEEKRGWLFLEDLGDVTLRDELKGRDLETHRRYYIQAIDELLRIQIQGTRLANPDCIAFGRAFDPPLLMWEFDHFLEYGVEVQQQKKMAPRDLQRARTAFEEMIRPLVAEPRYLTHRDYHSRNLMIQGGKIRVLDFQDALMGPAQYDLASLLRDSYLSLPEDLIGELIDYYIDRK
ncbi:MAG: aminoglycoside phosphotransferase family protein, partial [Nitrospiria bacterium]